MTRTYDRDRPVNDRLTPVQIAHKRAARFENPIDGARFMDAFRIARIAAGRGGDQHTYHAYRHALDVDDAVVVAGLIEGVASVPSPSRKRVF